MPREVGEKNSLFPDKEYRYACWSARDKYWECLDANESTQSSEPCANLRKAFEENCPPTWVKHFDRKKKYLKFKEKMEKGYEPLQQDKFKS